MQRDIFFRKHTYVDDIVKDLIVMRTLLPSHRPSGIVLTTLNGNHSSPQDTLGALLDLLKKDPTPTFNYVVHTGPISGASTKERYRSLMQMYPHHLTPSPRFVIVPDYGGMLGVSDSPYISWNGVQEDDAELVPVQDDHKRTSFMVYNSYQMERRPIVLKPDWFRPILAPAASVPQRYFDFADKLSTEYLNLRPERCGLKLEFGTLDEADRPHIGTLTNLVVQALNYKRQPAHRIDMPASATHDELEQFVPVLRIREALGLSVSDELI